MKWNKAFFMEIKSNEGPNVESDKIRQKASFIENRLKAMCIPILGYSFDSISINESKIYRYWFDFKLKNEKANRSIIFSYFPFDGKGQLVDSISISIRRQPYNNQFDYIILEKLISKYWPSYEIKELELAFYSGDFDERIGQLFEKIFYVLQLFPDIINGNSWEEDMYPKW